MGKLLRRGRQLNLDRVKHIADHLRGESPPCPVNSLPPHDWPATRNSGFPLDIPHASLDIGLRLLRKTSREENRMTSCPTFLEYTAQLRAFMEQASRPASAVGSRATETPYNRLAQSLLTLQFAHNSPYQKFCLSRNLTPDTISDWAGIPAIPTAAFKEFELTSLPVAERNVVFHSSGTTGHIPSQHFHSPESLAVYADSIRPWFRAHVLAGLGGGDESQTPVSPDKPPLFCLTPTPAQAPHSSLVHMFDTAQREFGSADSTFTGQLGPDGTWQVDFPKTLAALRRGEDIKQGVVLLGTAFSFVHLLDQLAENQLTLSLPADSRVLETGGYKGRSRHLPKDELHRLITRYLGVPQKNIICEYGMSELSSQAYDACAGEGADPARVFHFPPWARIQIISPETGREVAESETGLLRIYDLANVYSVMAIQTEDLAVRRGLGFELVGRATPAEPRGCSLLSRAESH